MDREREARELDAYLWALALEAKAATEVAPEAAAPGDQLLATQ